MTERDNAPTGVKPEDSTTADSAEEKSNADAVAEIGGPKGPDPTRFGDWSVKGRCIDF